MMQIFIKSPPFCRYVEQKCSPEPAIRPTGTHASIQRYVSEVEIWVFWESAPSLRVVSPSPNRILDFYDNQ